MTNAEHNAQIAARSDALRAARAQYDTIARDSTARVYADNAREQAARITGEMAVLRASLRGAY